MLIKGNAGDGELVTTVLEDHHVSSVMHFAGSIVVEESMTDPLKYYQNNTMVSRNLVESCIKAGVENFIFSSTAAVYGNPENIPVKETDKTSPINPYGQSKAMTEQILRDVANCSTLKFIALRYFNVSGADPGGRSGQVIDKATHLIKVACELAVGKRDGMSIFGTDYDTRDGTCIRDYIHVSDLADVHVKALELLQSTGTSRILNCGYGQGYSVREVLDTMQNIVQRPLNIKLDQRRAGDPGQLIADNELLRTLIDWKPKYNDIEKIIRDALEWERKLESGTLKDHDAAS